MIYIVLGMKVFVHGGAATPIPLLDALAKRGKEAQLKNVELIHIHTEGHDTVVSPEFDGTCNWCRHVGVEGLVGLGCLQGEIFYQLG